MLSCTSSTFSFVSLQHFRALYVSINLGNFYCYEIAACAALSRRAGKPVMKSQCRTDMPAAMCNIHAAKVSFKLVLAEFHTHF